MTLTIFTPTYNRVHTLQRLYNSLCTQTIKDFEWLIVDDGSTDQTSELIKNFIGKNEILITYIKQENGGKHRAINHGVKLAKGDLFMIVDSDDYLVDSLVVEKVVNQSGFLSTRIDFCGIVGNRCNYAKKVIGTSVKEPILDSNFLEYREKYKIIGDRAEIVKTSVMREFPFPEFEGEKFCPEGLIWNRIAQKYKARYINESYILCEYLDGGLSASTKKLRMNSSIAFMKYYSEYFSYRNVSMRSKIKSAIAYWATYFKSNQPLYRSLKTVGVFSVFLPLGLILHKVGRI